MNTIKVLVNGVEEEMLDAVSDEEIETNDDLDNYYLEDTLELDDVVEQIKGSGEHNE